MGRPLRAGETLEDVAQDLLGDRRLTHQLQVPGWDGRSEVEPGTMILLESEVPGPPAKQVKDWSYG
jgi:hypothetical protein